MLQQIGLVVALLAVAFLFAQIAYNAGLPPPAATVLVGAAAAGMLPHAISIELTPATLALFLPALIFEGAWEIHLEALRRVWPTIAVLAIAGTAVTALAIAGGALLGGVPLVAALALGAMLAATDPVAVIALFRALEVPLDLRTIVEGESIANDGVAAVLVVLVTGFATTLPTVTSVGLAIAQGVYAAVAGIAIGAALALASGRLLRGSASPAAALVTTLAVAYGAYALATVAGASGIFASAAAGVTLRASGVAKGDRAGIARAWDAIALVANAVVFLLVGLSLQFERVFHEPWLLLGTLLAVVLARVVLAYALEPLAARGTPRAWRHAIALAGVRGGLSLALALGLPADFPARAATIDAVFAVVFTTLVLQGWALGPVVRRLALR